MTFQTFILSRIGKGQSKLIKYLKPVDRKEDDPIRLNIVREFGFVPAPVLLHRSSRDLFAGIWMMIRESLLVGQVPRQFKESISLVVARQNQCPFCSESHAMALNGLQMQGIPDAISQNSFDKIEDREIAQLVAWADTRISSPATTTIISPFNSEQLPEMVGTIVLFHYLNRVVNVFLEDSPLPGPKALRSWKKFLQWAGGRAFEPLLNAKLSPGESLAFLPEADLPAEMKWAAASPHVAGAFARFDRAVESAAQSAISDDVRQCVARSLHFWRESEPELGTQWLDEATRESALSRKDESLTRLALMSALASYRVIASDVEAARREGVSDRELLAAVAWASFERAKQIGCRMASGERSIQAEPASPIE